MTSSFSSIIETFSSIEKILVAEYQILVAQMQHNSASIIPGTSGRIDEWQGSAIPAGGGCFRQKIVYSSIDYLIICVEAA